MSGKLLFLVAAALAAPAGAFNGLGLSAVANGAATGALEARGAPTVREIAERQRWERQDLLQRQQEQFQRDELLRLEQQRLMIELQRLQLEQARAARETR